MVWSRARGGLVWYQENPVPAVCKKAHKFFLCFCLIPIEDPCLLFQATLDSVALSQVFPQPFLPKSRAHTSHRLKLWSPSAPSAVHLCPSGMSKPKLCAYWKYGWAVDLLCVSPVRYDTAARSTWSSSNSLSCFLNTKLFFLQVYVYKDFQIFTWTKIPWSWSWHHAELYIIAKDKFQTLGYWEQTRIKGKETREEFKKK